MKVDKPDWMNQPNPLYAIDIDHEGKRVVTSGAQIQIWDIRPILSHEAEVDPSIPKRLATLTDHRGICNSARFSPKFNLLASGGDDQNVIVFQLRPGPGKSVFGMSDGPNVENWGMKHLCKGHSADVFDISWCPDGAKFASCSIDNKIIIWNALTGRQIAVLEGHHGHVKGLAWDPFNYFLASQGDADGVCIWSTSDWRLIEKVSGPYANSMGSHAYHGLPGWSPDGQILAATIAFDKVVHQAPLIQRNDWAAPHQFCGHRLAVTVARFSPKMRYLRKDKSSDEAAKICAVGSADCKVSIWSTAEDKPVAVVGQMFEGSVMDIAWTADGHNLLACSSDGSVAAMMFEDEELGRCLPAQDFQELLSKLFGEQQLRDAVAITDPEVLAFQMEQEKEMKERNRLPLSAQGVPAIGSAAGGALAGGNAGLASGSNAPGASNRQVMPAPVRRKTPPATAAAAAGQPGQPGTGSSSQPHQGVQPAQPGPITTGAAAGGQPGGSGQPPVVATQRITPTPVNGTAMNMSLQGAAALAARLGPGGATLPGNAATAQQAVGSAVALQGAATTNVMALGLPAPAGPSATTFIVGQKRPAPSDVQQQQSQQPAPKRHAGLPPLPPGATQPAAASQQQPSAGHRSLGNARAGAGNNSLQHQQPQQGAAASPVGRAVGTGHVAMSQGQNPLEAPPVQNQFAVMLSERPATDADLFSNANNRVQTTLSIKNHTPSGNVNSKPQAEIKCMEGGVQKWQDRLDGNVTLATGTQHFSAVVTTSGLLLLYSPAGRRLSAPAQLGGGGAALMTTTTKRPWLLLTLSLDGTLKVRDLKQNAAVLNISIRDLMAPGLRVACATISNSGLPIVQLSNHNAYVWSTSMHEWQCVADDSFAGSAFMTTMVDKASGEVAQLQAIAASVRPLSTAIRGGFSDVNQRITRAHLENNIASAVTLQNEGDYYKYMRQYAMLLVREGDKVRLQELIHDLLGPLRWHPDTHPVTDQYTDQGKEGEHEDAWNPVFFGTVLKRVVLQKIVLFELSRVRSSMTSLTKDAIASFKEAESTWPVQAAMAWIRKRQGLPVDDDALESARAAARNAGSTTPKHHAGAGGRAGVGQGAQQQSATPRKDGQQEQQTQQQVHDVVMQA